MKRLTRKAFLGGLGAVGAAALVDAPLGCARREAEALRAPTRLLIMHKPCGTIPDQYMCQGGERDFVLSPILEPLADFRSNMVILEGIDIPKREDAPGQDHGCGMVTFMTGASPIVTETFRAAIGGRASIDHLLADDPAISGDAPLHSLQLAADVRSERDEVFTRVLTYAGSAQPVVPESRPSAAFARVFAGLTDSGGQLTLERARARKESVLDYSRGRLGRLTARVGQRERERLESHLEAIRELERLLDRPIAPERAADLSRSLEGIDESELDDQHAEIGLAHLSIVRTAFQCDLTRVVTFGWAAGSSCVNFSHRIPGVQNLGHHALTHAGGPHREADEAAIHRYYNEQLATFLATLRRTPDVDGKSVLDHTLVVVWSEINLSRHTFANVPIQLYGGAGGRLDGGRLLRFESRTSNDLWAAIASALGHPMETFGDPERCAGPLPNVFS